MTTCRSSDSPETTLIPAETQRTGIGPDRLHRPKPLRIVYLEDNPNDQKLVARALKKAGLTCECRFVDRLPEFLTELSECEPDAILCDYRLPGYDTLAALRAAQELRPGVPFIFLSGTVAEERAVECLLAGATDYVLKDNLDRLGMVVVRAVNESEIRAAHQSAQAALRKSEERARLLFEYAPDAFYLIDLAGRFLDGNRAAEEVVGYRREELIGKSFLDLELLDASQRGCATESLARCAQGQATGPEEYRLRRKNGSLVTVEIRTYPVEIQGQMLVLGIARDVTGRKQAEVELRQSEERLRAVWEHSIDGMRLTDSRGRIIAVNEAYCRLVKLPRERLLGELFTVAYDESGTNGMLETYREQVESGKLVPRQTVRARLWNKQELDWDIATSAVEVGGTGKLVLTIFRDITERKVLEEAQRRLAAAVEQAGECIVITDVQGTIQYVNPAFVRVTGYSLQEALGQNPRLLKSGKQDAAFYQQMWQELSQGNSWNGRLINKRKDGTLIEADASITPIRDGAGRITNYVAVQHDVTHQVQLETQLRQSQKMEAVGQLAGGVAHDFNNLLLVMRGNAELLQMEPFGETEPARECLRQITAAAERAANLTRQLLAFSRKQVMQSQPVVLNEIIANVAKMLKRVIGEHIDLKCHYSIGLPYVQADAGMMEQVLVNLAVNARDAMPRGGELHISTERVELGTTATPESAEARPGEFVRLSVRDNGTGIAPEHMSHLFEPFFTTKQAGKGTGLGLATVYGIVKQHQGWIEVNSQPGAGATFRIFLPTVPAPPAKTPTEAREQTPRGGTETILLVEDEVAVRVMTRRVLEHFGYQVYEAARAKEAMDVWAAHREEIEVLLTDIVMPDGVNGWELAEGFHSQKPALKIILMSGYNNAAAEKGTAFLKKTKSQFIQKPCATNVLLEAVRKGLDAVS